MKGDRVSQSNQLSFTIIFRTALSAFAPPTSDSFSTPGPGARHDGGSDLPPPGRWGFLSVAFYRPYFDVDTVDVVERVRDSLLPWPRSNFLEKTSLNPDM